MFIVTGKKQGLVWDKDSDKPLARFKDGRFCTEDSTVAAKLKKLGYAVAEDAEKAAKAAEAKAKKDAEKAAKAAEEGVGEAQ